MPAEPDTLCLEVYLRSYGVSLAIAVGRTSPSWVHKARSAQGHLSMKICSAYIIFSLSRTLSSNSRKQSCTYIFAVIAPVIWREVLVIVLATHPSYCLSQPEPGYSENDSLEQA